MKAHNILNISKTDVAYFEKEVDINNKTRDSSTTTKMVSPSFL